MDIRKLLGISPKRKAGVAQFGSYAAPVDPEGLDPEMARTGGLVAAANAAVSKPAAAHDAALDSLAKKAGRLRQPYRSAK